MAKKKNDESQELNDRIDELTADLQRVHADFQNFRRRSEEERGEILALAKQDVILQLLPVLDNIDRALSYLPDNLAKDPWASGVSQVAKQADDVLRNLGIMPVRAHGQTFDPRYHEAVAGEGDQVIEVLQKGYILGDKVIRPAIVKVAKAKQEGEHPAEKQIREAGVHKEPIPKHNGEQ